MPLRILVLDPSAGADLYYKEALTKAGHRLQLVPDLAAAEKTLKETHRDERSFQLTIVNDADLAELSATLSALQTVCRHKATLLLTQTQDIQQILTWIQAGYFIALRPLSVEELRQTIKKLEKQIQLAEKQNNERLAELNIIPFLDQSHLELVLNNHPENIPFAITYMLAFLERSGVGEDDLFRVKLGITETLINAVAHGNLEMSSFEFKGREKNFDLWDAEMSRRAADPIFKDRKVRIRVDYRPNVEVNITIEDEGQGFDVSKVLAEGSGADMFDSFGRGLQMVKAMSNGLEFNDKGNQVILTYHITPLSAS